jgi:hypothetical protein
MISESFEMLFIQFFTLPSAAMVHLIYIHFQGLNHPCKPGINPASPWWIFLLMCWALQLAKFCRGFLHWCSLRILAYNFYSCIIFVCFGVGTILILQSLKTFLLQFLRRNRMNSSWDVCWNSAVKPSGTGIFSGRLFIVLISAFTVTLFSLPASSGFCLVGYAFRNLSIFLVFPSY